MDIPEGPRERRGYERRRTDRLRRETLDHLVRGVAHDLNNVLGVLLVQIDRIERSMPPPDPDHRRDDGRDAIDALYTVVGHGEALSDAITMLSRDHALEHDHLDLNEVIRETADLIRSAVPPGVHLHLDLDPSPCTAVILRGSLERVLLNGTLNAVRAMPEGGSLTISTRRERPPDLETSTRTADIVIAVTDDGIGIDRQIEEHAFEPDFTTRKEASGHGVGLAASRQLVAATGGSIDLHRATGRGSVLTIRYPHAPRLEAPVRRQADDPASDQRNRRSSPR